MPEWKITWNVEGSRKWMKEEVNERDRQQKKGLQQLSDYSSQHASPAAGNRSDFWEGEL